MMMMVMIVIILMVMIFVFTRLSHVTVVQHRHVTANGYRVGVIGVIRGLNVRACVCMLRM
jgi:hypothetical protein